MNKKIQKEPDGELMIRTLAMPADANPNGDIFGGWLVSQMDLAGLALAVETAKSRATTVAIDSMVFLHPVLVGDFICCYAKLLKVGRTSMRIKVQVFAITQGHTERHQVTEGQFTYVALDEQRKPQPVVREAHAK